MGGSVLQRRYASTVLRDRRRTHDLLKRLIGDHPRVQVLICAQTRPI
jgi:hypothetical protein